MIYCADDFLSCARAHAWARIETANTGRLHSTTFGCARAHAWARIETSDLVGEIARNNMLRPRSRVGED